MLKAMKRPYTREQFLTIVDALREKVPTLSLTTDIIVGFPGETEEDFQATCDLFDEIKFDMAFIFKYSPRPDTVAAELDDQIPQEIKEERNQILLQKVEHYSKKYNAKMVGKTMEVLVERPTKRGSQQLEGRTREHKKVIFTGNSDLIGKIIAVEIEGCTTATLLGKEV
jgi:tRNA-2-methylthio-N6-dimethylallyladenosine synthase